jgi:hypothetical protein
MVAFVTTMAAVAGVTTMAAAAGVTTMAAANPEGEVLSPGAEAYAPRVRDIETVDSELRLVAALRRAAGERGGPLPSIDVADRAPGNP